MEASVEQAEVTDNGTDPVAEEPEEDKAEHSEAERRSHADLFKYSTYLHVGPGAEECEEGENGRCENPRHFHAWCRLPNQFQHSSIREKALAAKARKLRLLRDPESDVRVILDENVEELIRKDSREEMIQEIAGKDFTDHYLEALREVGEQEEYKTVSEDQERFRVLRLMPEDERPTEEFEELEKHLEEYGKALQSGYDAIQEPLKQSLGDRSTAELGEMVREQRIDAEAENAYAVAYSQWEQFIGTLKPKSPDKPGMPSDRAFGDVNHMLAAAPEVIEALDGTFQKLDAEVSRAVKNS